MPFLQPLLRSPGRPAALCQALAWMRLILPAPSVPQPPGLTFLLLQRRLPLTHSEGSAKIPLDMPSTQKPRGPLCRWRASCPGEHQGGSPNRREQTVCPEQEHRCGEGTRLSRISRQGLHSHTAGAGAPLCPLGAWPRAPHQTLYPSESGSVRRGQKHSPPRRRDKMQNKQRV